jgi:hypothetical protein
VPGFDSKFDVRSFLHSFGVYLCRPCHSAVHRVYDNRELAEEFHTLEKLMASPRVAAWAAFNRGSKVRAAERSKVTGRERRDKEEEERRRLKREERDDMVALERMEGLGVGAEGGAGGKVKKEKRVNKKKAEKERAAAERVAAEKKREKELDDIL